MNDQIPQNQPENTNDSTADTLMAVEGLIRNQLTQIEELSSQAKNLREMYDDLLVNDAEYSKATEQAKEAVKAKTITKKAALTKPEAQSLAQKLKDTKEQLRDFQESLSLHLQQYAKLSGTETLEIEPGDIRQIVFKARLIKAPGSFK